jgi:cold shock CspA family protein
VIGTIKALRANYGFIRADDGAEYFFHDEDLVGAKDIELAVGDRVSFEVVDPAPAKGPRARDVCQFPTEISADAGQRRNT